MIKKQFAIALSMFITAVSLGLPATAMAQASTGVETIRAKVQLLSASKDSQVEVKFHDKTKVKGYIVAVEPVSFSLKDPKDGKLQSITYSEVDSVKKASGISTKTWLIVAGAAAGAVTTFLIVKPAVCDGGAQTRGIC